MIYDYCHVAPEHYAIHDRLLNWALWVNPGSRSAMAPMFRLYRSKARQWHTPELKPAINTQDAQHMEQAVRSLSPDQRDAIRWCYVRKHSPARQCKAIGCTHEGLYHLIQAGRGNLAVRLLTTAKHDVISRPIAREYA
jgi:hypothetical protein